MKGWPAEKSAHASNGYISYMFIFPCSPDMPAPRHSTPKHLKENNKLNLAIARKNVQDEAQRMHHTPLQGTHGDLNKMFEATTGHC